MKLSIIIPVYNEEKTIKRIIDKINKVKVGLKKEIIIVDDGSTDKTRDILNKINQKGTKIFYHEKNKGKGGAIRKALKHVTGDIIIIQDADLEYDPMDYPKLISPILKNKAKVVYGSRFLKSGLMNKQKWAIPSHFIGNKILSLVTTMFYQRYITDMETCYKVFRKEVLKNIKIESNRFDFEPEITAKLLKNKIDIVEIPISYKARHHKEGKKISWIDGIKAIITLIKYRLK